MRRRLDSYNTNRFHIITLQRPSAGNYFFDGLDKISVSIKQQENFISKTNPVRKTNWNMDNLSLLNEEDRELRNPILSTKTIKNNIQYLKNSTPHPNCSCW
jgi:hypothetical protein